MTAPATDLYHQIYDEYMAKAADPAWRFAMEVFIGELLQQNATYHQAQIQAIADWAAERQLNRHKTAITKRYIAERLEEVTKAKRRGPRPTAAPSTGYDGFNETLWRRSPNGQFARYVGPDHLKASYWQRADGKVVEHHERGVFSPKPSATPRSVISEAIARRPENERNHPASSYGLLNSPEALPAGVPQSQHAIDVAHAFDRMTYSLANRTGNAEDKQRVQFVISSPDGYHRVVTPKAGKMPELNYGKGERVSFMTPVGPDNPVTIAGQAINIGHVAGMSDEQAAKAGTVAQDVHGALTKTSWGDKMTHTANAMRVISNDSPMAVQAHAVAQLFNVLGPDASRAFGNKLKQLTYRYMGMEVPSTNYSPAARAGRQVGSGGQIQSVRDYERQLATDLVPSIPSSSEYSLALQAGSTPPSRGYILNSDGRVVSEAVGYADDWYTPFNLKKLPQMRGGSYVRTRGYGGLTPEDIRLAMRTGAKRATVISNNGVFTMEFEPKALHWGHRFGFVGNGMVKRYAKALDALKGQQVGLKDGTDGKMKLNTTGYTVAMRDLQMKNPNWIVADNNQTPFHQSLREFGNIDRAEVIGEDSLDRGYMGPLDIHAKEAKAGWHDETARDIWSDKNGKYAWNEVDRGRVNHDYGLGLVSRLGGNGKGNNGGSSSSGTFGGDSPLGGGGGGAASGDGKRNRFDIYRHQIRVDGDGNLRDYDNDYCNPAGRKISGGFAAASRQRNELKATNPEYARVGSVFNKTDSWQSTRPIGESTPDAGRGYVQGTPASTYEQELRDRSHHWDQDDAISTATDVRAHLLRLKELEHLPADTKHWKALNLAREATLSDDYATTTAYADFVQKLQVSPTYRKQLATDLHDAIDGQHLSNEFTHLEPGQLLAELREQEYDPKAVSPDTPAASEEDPGDRYESMSLGSRPLAIHEVKDNHFVKSWLKGLDEKERNGTEPEQARAKTSKSEYLQWAQMSNQIVQQRTADEKAKRQPRSVDECLRNQPADKVELFKRVNRYLSDMLDHGTQVAAENYTDRATLKGDTVPFRTHVMDEKTTRLKHDEALVKGHTTGEDAGDAEFDDVMDVADNEAAGRATLRTRAKQYLKRGEYLHRSGQSEAAGRFMDTHDQIMGRLGLDPTDD